MQKKRHPDDSRFEDLHKELVDGRRKFKDGIDDSEYVKECCCQPPQVS